MYQQVAPIEIYEENNKTNQTKIWHSAWIPIIYLLPWGATFSKCFRFGFSFSRWSANSLAGLGLKGGVYNGIVTCLFQLRFLQTNPFLCNVYNFIFFMLEIFCTISIYALCSFWSNVLINIITSLYNLVISLIVLVVEINHTNLRWIRFLKIV